MLDKAAIADAFAKLPDVTGATYRESGTISVGGYTFDLSKQPAIEYTYDGGREKFHLIPEQRILHAHEPRDVAAFYSECIAQRIERDRKKGKAA